ncbi:MAG: hypothetical protein V2A74_14050 [bacterium]
MQPRFFRRLCLAVAALLVVGLLAGCACFERKNRRLLSKSDEYIQPESKAARIALAPVGVVVGTVFLAADMALIQPVCVIDDAWDDVYDLYWKPRDMDPLRKTLLFVPMVVLTPPTFVADWLGRSLFDIE